MEMPICGGGGRALYLAEILLRALTGPSHVMRRWRSLCCPRRPRCRRAFLINQLIASWPTAPELAQWKWNKSKHQGGDTATDYPASSRRRPCRARPGHALKTCTRPRTTNGSTTCTLRSARCAAYVRAPCVAEHRELSGTRAQVTTDIYDDAERQHLTLDDTVRFCAIPRHGCAC
jgi:hypothetical protein